MVTVSVLMPAYNASRYIVEAIESVLTQTFTDFELIIVDDCSTDNTWEIITSFTDKRIRAYRNKVNLHISGSRNRLVSLARGKYLAMLDADDVMLSDRLKKQVAFLEKHKEYAMVGSDLILINEYSQEIGKRVYPKTYEDICYQVLVRNPFAQSSIMVRNEGIRYDETFSVSEDYALWCNIASRHKVANMGPLIKYRLHSTQTVNARLKEHLLAVLRIQKKWLSEKKFRTSRAILQYYLFFFAQFFPSFVLRFLR